MPHGGLPQDVHSASSPAIAMGRFWINGSKWMLEMPCEGSPLHECVAAVHIVSSTVSIVSDESCLAYIFRDRATSNSDDYGKQTAGKVHECCSNAHLLEGWMGAPVRTDR